MKRTLVTGANGHLGANLVRELLQDGQRVRGFVRPGADLSGIDGLDVELVRGDVLDAASLRAAADGCEVVHHTATPYVTNVRDPDEVIRPAVEGARNLVGAARDAKVSRVVFTSSSNVVGFTTDPSRPRSEADENDLALSPYVRAKVQSERVARDAAREAGLEVVFANPTGVLGRYDYKITPTTQIVIDLVTGRMPAAFGVNAVDVRDVARAHRLLAEKGRPGERYLIGSDNLSADDLAALVEEASGRPAKRAMPPRWVLMAIASVAEAASALARKAPPITRVQVTEAYGRHLLFDTTRMRTELGLEPTPGKAVFDEALRWCLFRGRLPAPIAERLRPRLPPPAEWTSSPKAAPSGTSTAASS